MGSSWDHAVRRLTEEEIAFRVRQDWPCSTGKCRETVSHATSYRYVTGRGGRVSFSERLVCAAHAERFAAKHEVEVTDAPRREHAIEGALRQAFGAPPSAGTEGEVTGNDPAGPDLFKVIELDTMTGWRQYLNNMSGEHWTGTFTRKEAEASVKWREENITRRYSYEIVPVEPWMTDNDAARERHDGRNGRHGPHAMEDCSDVACREASARIARDKINRQFAAADSLERVRAMAQGWTELKGDGLSTALDRRVGEAILSLVREGAGTAEDRLSRVTGQAEGWLTPGNTLYYPAAGQAVLDAINGGAAQVAGTEA